MANPVVHFEIMAQDPERAARFYQDVFGWQINKWGEHPYWLIQTNTENAETSGSKTSAPSAGINGGIMASKGESLSVNSIQVLNLEDALAKVKASGGEQVVPVRAIPGVGYVAYCKDTEGIVFGLHQPDPAAK